MRADAEMDGLSVKADQLREAQTCLSGEQEQCVITVPEPRRAVGSGKDRLDLGVRQEIHLTFVVALARYRENSLDQGAVGRLLEGGEPEERPNGRQTQVARSGTGTPPRLEIGEERTDQRPIEIVEGQCRGRLAEPRLCKREQQPERISVGSDRVGGNVALTHESVGKVALDQSGDVAAGLHGLASQRRSSRRGCR